MEDEDITSFQIPQTLTGCCNCEKCSVECNIKDGFQSLVEAVEEAEYVLLG